MNTSTATLAWVKTRFPIQRRTWRRLALLWTAVVVALTLVPGAWLARWFPVNLSSGPSWIRRDWIAHGLGFAALGLLYRAAQPDRPRWLLLAFALGIGLELAQQLVDGRTSDWGDALVNLTGATLGGWLGGRLTHPKTAS